uniref:Alcohol dehydrogenase 1 n=2 Tax=Anthurium amnicola TaxID=1678845 RepID=A0A1D1ZHH3_9ARAE
MPWHLFPHQIRIRVEFAISCKKLASAEMAGGGVDQSIQCTGNINAMTSAFECVHDGWGVAVLVGAPNKDAVSMTKPLNKLNERTHKGTIFWNYKPQTDLPFFVDTYMKMELDVEKFITHRISFSEMNKAFDYMLKEVFVVLLGWMIKPATWGMLSERDAMFG